MPPRVELLQQRHDLDAGARVERTGRLVGENQRRVVDERARDRHALLLAARQLRGLMIGALAEPDLLQLVQRARMPVACGHVGIHQRQLDVLERAGARQQVELLEHEADAPLRTAARSSAFMRATSSPASQ